MCLMQFHASSYPLLHTQVLTCFVAVFILTDFACALLPLAFIRKINRPLRERVVLAVLMGLGLFVGACGVAKMVMMKATLFSKDPIFDGTTLGILA
jgi:hypothetical protein